MYDIVADHEDFVVIYKKPNVSFHSDSGTTGLFETLKQREQFAELYPVHRLDKVTSGLLVMAKNASTNAALTQQFRLRQVEKYYLAISQKKPKKKQGLIKGDMHAARRGAWKLEASLSNPAVTQFFSGALGAGARLFLLKPHTGKTHQLRVALKSIGAPIAGDLLYADVAGNRHLDRTYLHAYSLGFSLKQRAFRFTELPREGELYAGSAFTSAVQVFVAPWELSWPRLGPLGLSHANLIDIDGAEQQLDEQQLDE